MIITIINKWKKGKVISCPNTSPFTEYEVGDYVCIIRDNSEEPILEIHNSDDVRLVGKVDSEGRAWDSNSNFLGDTNEFLGTWAEANQRYADMAESTRFQNQVLQFQTSWDMPPKW